jgi:hypothetical protein
MKITNHHLAEMAGWHRVHYYDFIRFDQRQDINRGKNMYRWVQENVAPDKWVSWNGDMWFKDSGEATMFTLVWA